MNLITATAHLSAHDEAMARLIAAAGPVELPPVRGDFETLVDAIVSQQLSTKAAATIMSRLTGVLEHDVSPQRILRTDARALRAAGLSGQKTSYLYALADAFVTDAARYGQLHELDDAEVIRALTAIKGIGVWTAQMFLIFTLLREDVFPIDDLGIRRGMERYILPGLAAAPHTEREKRRHMELHAEAWRPFRSIASLYLWRGVDTKP